MSVNLPEYVRNRNIMLSQAFENMKETVRRIQYWIEDEWLRICVLSDFSKDDRSKYIIKQLGTSFCVLSLGTDVNGEYSIVLSIDSQINDKIGQNFSSILLRRLFEFTPESCAYHVRISNFSKNCDSYLETILEESKRGKGFHSVTVTPFEGK